MLVKGQTLMGTISPSYVCMMEFVVAAQGIIKETLCAALQGSNLGNTPSHLLCKINQLISNSEVLATFVRTKVAQKALGCSPSGQTAQRHKAAAYLQATYAPDKSRIKQIFASHLAVCLFRLSRNPKPDNKICLFLSFSGNIFLLSFSGLTRESKIICLTLGWIFPAKLGPFRLVSLELRLVPCSRQLSTPSPRVTVKKASSGMTGLFLGVTGLFSSLTNLLSGMTMGVPEGGKNDK
jgi:hypothetical protein